MILVCTEMAALLRDRLCQWLHCVALPVQLGEFRLQKTRGLQYLREITTRQLRVSPFQVTAQCVRVKLQMQTVMFATLDSFLDQLRALIHPDKMKTWTAADLCALLCPLCAVDDNKLRLITYHRFYVRFGSFLCGELGASFSLSPKQPE